MLYLYQRFGINVWQEVRSDEVRLVPQEEHMTFFRTDLSQPFISDRDPKAPPLDSPLYTPSVNLDHGAACWI